MPLVRDGRDAPTRSPHRSPPTARTRYRSPSPRRRGPRISAARRRSARRQQAKSTPEPRCGPRWPALRHQCRPDHRDTPSTNWSRPPGTRGPPRSRVRRRFRTGRTPARAARRCAGFFRAGPRRQADGVASGCCPSSETSGPELSWRHNGCFRARQPGGGPRRAATTHHSPAVTATSRCWRRDRPPPGRRPGPPAAGRD